MEGCLEADGDQSAGWVRFGEVLDGLDHLVCSIMVAYYVLLKRTRCSYDRRFLGSDDRLERKPA